MPSSRHCHGAFLAALLSVAALAQSPPQSSSSSPSPPANDAASRPAEAHVTADARERQMAAENDAIWSALNRPFAGMAIQDLPLDQALSSFLDNARIRNWHVRWQTFFDASVARDKRITVKLHDTTVWRALDLILDEAGGPDCHLRYEPIDGVLILSTEEDLDRRTETRVYPIADLIAGDLTRMRQRLAALREKPMSLPDPLSDAAEGHFRAAIERMKAAETTSSANDESNEDDEDDEPRAYSPMIVTINLIQTLVQPDSWVVNGGCGSIGAYSGSLVVRNNVSAHRALSRLLNDLRAAEIENADRKRTRRPAP